MGKELIERLRINSCYPNDDNNEAADEIERLTAELAEVTTERNTLQRCYMGYQEELAALKAQSEPVAWLDLSKMTSSGMVYATGIRTSERQSPLYTAPQPASAERSCAASHVCDCQEAGVQCQKDKPAIAEVERDAERYRWLRHGDNDEAVMKSNSGVSWLLRNKELDATIDAKVTKQKGNT